VSREITQVTGIWHIKILKYRIYGSYDLWNVQFLQSNTTLQINDMFDSQNNKYLIGQYKKEQNIV
jgi:hypothetical protein